MKNLENYGVQTMNTLEFKTINGGYSEEDWNNPSQETVWLPTVRNNHPLNDQYAATGGRNPLSPLGQLIADWLWGN